MNLKAFRNIFAAAALFFGLHLSAQESAPALYPQPQSVQFTGVRFAPKQSFSVTGNTALDADALVLLKEILAGSSHSLPVEINTVEKKDPQLQRSGAYRLLLSPQKITIEAFDGRSFFYAVQTLEQLVQKDKNGALTLPAGEITDYPDVTLRGTVEGFYGEPWSHQDRLEQLRFYGKLKLNTYIYGPKDDPYHSSPHWRDAYPADKAAQLKELVSEAKKNKVDFVWAVHPGKDIQWNREDSNAVLRKFEKMYDLGVRSFAVFFDDISGAGTDAGRQAGLLNFLQHSFVEAKKDVTPLIMCPTEYNKAWANKKEGTYLDILGAQLHPAIQVMWTGNTVVADNTTEGLTWVNKRIRRPALVWWNFPVSDYVRDHLLLGAAYGLDTDAAPQMSGFVSNPMDKAEASKPAIFSVALYTWNTQQYHPQEAWKAALRYVMPEAPEAFQLFAAHNSDPGPNGHRFRRQESVQIKPAIDSFLQHYKTGNYPKTLAKQIEAEFARMLTVAGEIKSKSKNKRLVEQLSPWLTQFELLAKAGMQALQMSGAGNDKRHAAAWQHYLQLSSLLDSMAVVDKTFNQNPYQTGVKTGSLVLMPFIKTVQAQTALLFESGGKESGAQTKDAAQQGSSVFTNTEKLRHQPLRISNGQVAITPLLEVVTLQPGEFAGLQLHPGLRPTALHLNLENNNLQSWGRFEASADGQQWQPFTPSGKRGKGSYRELDEKTRFVRILNRSEKPQSFYLKELRLEVAPAGEGGTPVYATDGSIHTAQPFAKESPLRLPLAPALAGQPMALLLKTAGAPYTLWGIGRKGKRTILYNGNADFVQIPKAKTKGFAALELTTEAVQPLLVYELVKWSGE